MECPLTPARLHQLHWEQRWEIAQLAVLGAALTGEPVTESQVRAWLSAAGIAERRPTPLGVKPPRPARKRGSPPRHRVTLPCEQCGVPVERVPSEVFAHVFCGRPCSHAWRAMQARIRRAARKCQTARDFTPQKRCPRCEGVKPLADYAVDVSRGDGRGRLCRECSRAKSRAYYLANQERLRAAALARKQARNAEKPPASDT